jgi:hypothetical protein
VAKHFSLKLLLDYIDKSTGKSFKDTTCQYRGPKGKKCFVGVYIPDRQYRDEMEGGLSHLKDYLSWISPNRDFLDDLQEIHDNSCSLDWSDRKSEFKQRVIDCFRQHKKRIDI